MGLGDPLSQCVGAKVVWCVYVFSFEVSFSLLADMTEIV